jgi:uncharacterized membrane protein YbaN (DUF454 family)
MKKALWYSLGMLSLAMAYIGFIVPGIPFSIFLVFAAYCFAKSSKKMHDWLYNHKWFGEFLTNWTNHRVFPLKAKYTMLAVMSSSLAIMWFTTGNIKAMIWAGVTMLVVAVWTWRYPSSIDQIKK